MDKLRPQDLTSMPEVTRYWKQCLDELADGTEDEIVASHMVGVVANSHDEEWSGAAGHPAYPIIFELAGSLELPPDMTSNRTEAWACVKALVNVLQKRYLEE